MISIKHYLPYITALSLVFFSAVTRAETIHFSAEANQWIVPTVKIEEGGSLFNTSLMLQDGMLVLANAGSFSFADPVAPLASISLTSGRFTLPYVQVSGEEYFRLVLDSVPNSKPLKFAVVEVEPVNPLRIGGLFEFSGLNENNAGNLQAYESSLLAIHELNEAGFDVVLLSEDSATDMMNGHTAAGRLLDEEKAQVLLTGVVSEISLAVAEQYALPNNLLQISYGSFSPALTALPADEEQDLLFRTQLPLTPLAIALAKSARNMGYQKLAMIYMDVLDGQGFERVFRDAFTLFGGEIVASVPLGFAETQTGYQDELQQAAQAGTAEALVIFGLPPTMMAVAQEALVSGLFNNFLSFMPLQGAESFIPTGAETFLEGACAVIPKIVADAPAWDEYHEHFQAAYIGDRSARMFGEQAFDAVILATLAGYAAEVAGDSITNGQGGAYLRQVANPPGIKVSPATLAYAKELLAAGQDIDYNGASGDVDFDVKGDILLPMEFICMQNGQRTLIEDWDISSLSALIKEVGDSQFQP